MTGSHHKQPVITSIIDSLSSTTSIHHKHEAKHTKPPPAHRLPVACESLVRSRHRPSASLQQSSTIALGTHCDIVTTSLSHNVPTIPESSLNLRLARQGYSSVHPLTPITLHLQASPPVLQTSPQHAPLAPHAEALTTRVCPTDGSPDQGQHHTSANTPCRDSVPMRSSSIGQAQKQNQQKRSSSAASTRVSSPSAHTKRKPVMSEKVFKDLGEDNVTVKRIRELKQQRASRLLHVDDLPSLADADNETHSADETAPPLEADVAAQVQTTGLAEDPRDTVYAKTSDSKQLSSARWLHRSDREGEALPTPPQETSDRHRHSDDISLDIDTFLASHRFSQTAWCSRTHRKISFSEVGDPRGAVVFVCVGMGLSRFVTLFYDDLASSLRLRLITPERPGVGDSDHYQDSTQLGPLNWHQDVLAICKQLQITRFSLLGHSAGAIYALSTALALPTFVRGSVYLLAPWIPPSQFSMRELSLSPDPDALIVSASLPRSQRLLRILPVQVLKATNAKFLGLNTGSMSPPSKRSSDSRDSPTPSPSPSRTRKVMCTPVRDGIVQSAMNDDQATMSATASPVDAEFSMASSALSASEHQSQQQRNFSSALLTEKIWTLATQNSNPSVDLLVCLEKERTVGFRYVDIQQRVVMIHGEQDKRVPVENVRWLAEQMNRRRSIRQQRMMPSSFGCELRVLPDEGHGLMANAIVMGNVLTELAHEAKMGDDYGTKTKD